MAVVDELAGAGELVKGKCDQVPVAVVRGYLTAPTVEDGPGVTVLVRAADSDLFSLGTAEATAAGLRAAATLRDGGNAEIEEGAVARALATAGVPATFDGVAVTAEPAGTTPDDLVRFGADVHRLRAALAAEGVASTLLLDLESSSPRAVLRL